MTTTADKVREIATRRLAKEEQDAEVWAAILSALKKHEGHKVTKRLGTTVEKALADKFSSVYYDKGDRVFGGAQLFLWGGASDRTYDDRMHLFFPKDTYSEAAMIEKNPPYGRGTPERISKVGAFLAGDTPERMAKALDAYMKARDTLAREEFSHYETDVRYDIDDEILKGGK